MSEPGMSGHDWSVWVEGDHFCASYRWHGKPRVEFSLENHSKAAGGLTHKEALAKAEVIAEAAELAHRLVEELPQHRLHEVVAAVLAYEELFTSVGAEPPEKIRPREARKFYEYEVGSLEPIYVGLHSEPDQPYPTYARDALARARAGFIDVSVDVPAPSPRGAGYWLGQPLKEGLRAGPLRIHTWCDGQWRVILQADSEVAETDEELCVVNGTEDTVDELTRAWLASLANLEAK